MKKILSLILCLFMLFSLASCIDSKDKDASEGSGITINENGIPEKDGVEGVELPDIIIDNNNGNEKENSSENEKNDSPDSAVSSDGTVTELPDSSGSSEEQGSEGQSTPSHEGDGIELPEYDF
jgi:hypothetical protein